jgi:hypothetical protein
MENQGFGAVARELLDSFRGVVKSELQLAQAELKGSFSVLPGRLGRVALFCGIAALGIPPFLAFLVVGLGRILGDNYWLSALIVSVVFLATGGILAWLSLHEVKRAVAPLQALPKDMRGDLARVGESATRVVDRARTRLRGVARREPEMPIPVRRPLGLVDEPGVDLSERKAS